MRELPIDPLLPDVVATLRDGNRLVLRAPPGAGKTTRVPAALLDAGLAADRQVVVLEPRRIATRAAAEFVARERGGAVGGEVGYRVRFEQRGGPATRLWYVTEGVLGRQLTRDAFLEDVAVVVLDEFHERHLQGDVVLAIVRELQESVRPDLKLVVMSATLDTAAVSTSLGGCPVLTSEGRAFPVEIEYEAEGDDRPLAGRVATAVRRLLAAGEAGDMLVFLPGAAEIRRAAGALEELAREQGIDVVPLHGEMPLDEQHRAIRPGPRRKVVLSTNVAETALTIEGVTAVIDSGLARFAWFDARHGINAHRVAPISRAAADQRAGRAGRTRPGRCLRLWPRSAHGQRREREVPEILRLDLSGTVLELRAWGLRKVEDLVWVDSPPSARLAGAERLLEQLGALDRGTGKVTDTGATMLGLGLPPRLARVLVESERRGCPAAGAQLAALVSERDICLSERAFAAAPAPAAVEPGSSDLLRRLELYRRVARDGFDRASCLALGVDVHAARAVDRLCRQLERRGLRGSARDRRGEEDDDLLRCILAGFPDRVARRREPGSPRAVMAGGRGVTLLASSVVRSAEFFVCLEVESGRPGERSEGQVRMASAVRREWLEELFPGSIERVEELYFDEARECVLGRTRDRYLGLVLNERTDSRVDPARAGEVLAEEVRRDWNKAVEIGEDEEQLLRRIEVLGRWAPETGMPSDIRARLIDAVVALCPGRRSLAELRRTDVGGLIRGLLSYAQSQALQREVPARFELPGGRSVRIEYHPDRPPKISARVQELFGLSETPRLACGRLPLVVEILAPNQRPVQVTDDLASFWRTTYAEVRKQLRGRYPRHRWPENPLEGAAEGPRRRSN